MKKRNIIALSIFGVFYISFGVFLTLNQEDIIYHPFPQDFASCTRLSGAESITFNGTRMYVYNVNKPTAVLYHGNAGSACDRDFYANLFTQAGYGYVIVEYAGFSDDTQDPTHSLIKKDVENVIVYLKKENVSNVTVVGESIGTGVASYHTSLETPEKLILISPFTDLSDIAKSKFWFYPTSLLVDNAFNNETSLQNYTGPTLVVHGDADSTIPYKLGEKLFDGLSAEKEFVTIIGAGHNDLFTYQQTHAVIQEFLSRE